MSWYGQPESEGERALRLKKAAEQRQQQEEQQQAEAARDPYHSRGIVWPFKGGSGGR